MVTATWHLCASITVRRATILKHTRILVTIGHQIPSTDPNSHAQDTAQPKCVSIWCPGRDSNPHALALAPKASVSTISPPGQNFLNC